MYHRISKRAVVADCVPGFTLVEMLVASSLALLVLGTAFILFNQFFAVSDAASLMEDANGSLRASVNLIARDLTGAGSGIPIGGVPLPGGTGAQPVRRPGPGTNYFPTGSGVISAVTPGFGLGPTLEGSVSDIITILVDDPSCTLGGVPLAGINSEGTEITVDPSTDLSGSAMVYEGDTIMFTSSRGTALGMVTRVDLDTRTVRFDTGDPLGLNQPGAESGTLASLKNEDGTYPPTTATRIFMNTYYLDVTDANQPRLMRQVGAGTPFHVAGIITALQFSYDLSDGTTTNQRTVTTPNQIRKVNLMARARSERPWRQSGQFYTNTLTTSITIRNLAYRNKYL